MKLALIVSTKSWQIDIEEHKWNQNKKQEHSSGKIIALSTPGLMSKEITGKV